MKFRYMFKKDLEDSGMNSTLDCLICFDINKNYIWLKYIFQILAK